MNSGNALKPERFFNTWLRNDVPNPCSGYLDKALWHDLSQVGLPETLHSDDALSMAFSLESRPPFLDHRLVEFCFSLGHGEKIRDGLTKSILRRAMKDVLPPVVLSRRDKKGMPTPYVPFLTDRQNVAALRELLLEGELVGDGLLDRKGTERLLSNLQKRFKPLTTPVIMSIWRIATLELWHRLFISRSLTEH